MVGLLAEHLQSVFQPVRSGLWPYPGNVASYNGTCTERADTIGLIFSIRFLSQIEIKCNRVYFRSGRKSLRIQDLTHGGQYTDDKD